MHKFIISRWPRVCANFPQNRDESDINAAAAVAHGVPKYDSSPEADVARSDRGGVRIACRICPYLRGNGSTNAVPGWLCRLYRRIYVYHEPHTEMCVYIYAHGNINDYSRDKVNAAGRRASRLITPRSLLAAAFGFIEHNDIFAACCNYVLPLVSHVLLRNAGRKCIMPPPAGRNNPFALAPYSSLLSGYLLHRAHDEKFIFDVSIQMCVTRPSSVPDISITPCNCVPSAYS